MHLRTTNPIESMFSTVKVHTKVTHGAGSPEAALAMLFKLIGSAQARTIPRRLRSGATSYYRTPGSPVRPGAPPSDPRGLPTDCDWDAGGARLAPLRVAPTLSIDTSRPIDIQTVITSTQAREGRLHLSAG